MKDKEIELIDNLIKRQKGYLNDTENSFLIEEFNCEIKILNDIKKKLIENKELKTEPIYENIANNARLLVCKASNSYFHDNKLKLLLELKSTCNLIYDDIKILEKEIRNEVC